MSIGIAAAGRAAVAQAFVPAVSRFVSTLLPDCDTVSEANVGMTARATTPRLNTREKCAAKPKLPFPNDPILGRKAAEIK